MISEGVHFQQSPQPATFYKNEVFLKYFSRTLNTLYEHLFDRSRIVNHKICDLIRSLTEQACVSVIPDQSRMTLISYLTDASERGCQTGICISRTPVLCLAPGPGPGSQFVLTGPGPRFVFSGPGSQFVFTGPGPQFALDSPGLEFAFTGLAPNLCLAALAQNLYLLVLAFYLLFTSSGQDFTTSTAAACTINTTTITTTTTTTTATSTTRDNNNKRCLCGSEIHFKWLLKDN